MRFEWDPAKRRSNIEKHGFDFVRARRVFDGRPAVTAPSPRMSEERFRTIAMLDGEVVVVVWTERDEDMVRIISVRRASDAEERQFRQLFS